MQNLQFPLPSQTSRMWWLKIVFCFDEVIFHAINDKLFAVSAIDTTHEKANERVEMVTHNAKMFSRWRKIRRGWLENSLVCVWLKSRYRFLSKKVLILSVQKSIVSSLTDVAIIWGKERYWKDCRQMLTTLMITRSICVLLLEFVELKINLIIFELESSDGLSLFLVIRKNEIEICNHSIIESKVYKSNLRNYVIFLKNGNNYKFIAHVQRQR